MEAIRNLFQKHPGIIGWAALSIGMVLILTLYLAFGATDVHLKAGQLATIVVATVIVAGLCVWIIRWE